jgi:WD40 repeat protein
VGEDRSVRVWEATTGRVLLTYKGHRDVVVIARFRPDGRHVVSLDAGFTVRVWDVTDGHDVVPPRTIRTSASPWFGNGWAVRPDGRELAILHRDGTIQLWDLATGQETPRILRGHTGQVVGLAYTPDGRRLASTSALGGPDDGAARPGGELKLWDIATGRELATPRRGIGVFRVLAFSPDGRRLVLSGGHGVDPDEGRHEAHIWDAETGAEVSILRGHTGIVQEVAFSPDGSRFASAAWDNTVKLWDGETGQEVFTFRGHTAGVNGVAFSPKGDRLVSGSIDWTARVWDATPLKPEAPQGAEPAPASERP